MWNPVFRQYSAQELKNSYSGKSRIIDDQGNEIKSYDGAQNSYLRLEWTYDSCVKSFISQYGQNGDSKALFGKSRLFDDNGKEIIKDDDAPNSYLRYSKK